MSLGRSLRTICAVSGSSLRGTSFGKLKELVEDVEWKVAMDDMSCMCVLLLGYLVGGGVVVGSTQLFDRW